MIQLLLLLVLLGLMFLSLLGGDIAVTWGDVGRSLLGLPGVSPGDTWVVHQLRLPRTLIAVGAGMALALAGTLTQGITRNPLASPSVLGFTGGAALGAIGSVVLLPTGQPWLVSLAALGGALGVALLLVVLTQHQSYAPLRLVLVGLGLGLGTAAALQIFLALGDLNQVSQGLFWLTGSVYGRTWGQVALLWPALGFLVLILVGTRQSQVLDALALGEGVAQGLGVRLGWQRGSLLGCSVVLTAIAVAAAGSIGFVGLMAPHVARQWVGALHRDLLPTAALVGGVLVVGSDGLGRWLFAPIEVPCGVITAAIGGSYFLYLLLRQRRPSA
ncbi:FecCD family ABC transporter permease [Prochlorothrix hollandica]|uniref:FecCD family ABC transporter permease n=1 Tax=Prochlorothrix hollandica TaxID=1223 RepID=UPI00333EC4A3